MRALVSDPSQIAEARRFAVGQATASGFDEAAIGRIALVATEMATTLLKHAGAGLGAMRRQSDRFAIWSHPGLGTAVMARFSRGDPAAGMTIGAVVDPIAGETVS